MNRLLATIIITGLTTLFAATAHADAKGSLLARTKFREALRSQDWRGALAAYNQIQSTDRTTRLQLLAADAHYRLGEMRPCASLLSTMLKRRPDNLEALFLLAKVRAGEGNLAEAKSLLLDSARAGQQVMRDITTGDAKKLFAKIARDPSFILAVMRRSQEVTVEFDESTRNPFQRLEQKKDRPARKTPRTGTKDEIALALKQEIEALFEDMDELASKHNIGQLVRKLGELRGLLVEFEELGLSTTKKVLARFKRRGKRMRALVDTLQLHIYVAEGNLHLQAMAKSLKKEDYAGTIKRFARVKTLVAAMNNESRSIFQRTAKELFLRGKRIHDRAALFAKIESMKLVVTGIVVPPKGEARAKVIINDRIYATGEPIVDPTTDEAQEDLLVESVKKSAVTFSYRGVRFVRSLKQRRLR